MKSFFVCLLFTLFFSEANCKTTGSFLSFYLPDSTISKGMPNREDVLLLIMENYNFPLPITDPNCGRTIQNLNDRTLGKFLAKYWQRHMTFKDNHQNFITVEVVEGANPSIYEKHWWIYFEIWGKVGDAEPWSGGVRFYILDKDWKIIRETMECYAGE